MREHGVRSRSIFNVNGGLFIVHREAIETVFKLAFDFWQSAKGQGFKRPLIELALKAYNGNQVKTAIMLGINRNTLKKKIDNYKLKPKKGAQAATTTVLAQDNNNIVVPVTTLTQ